MDIPATMQTLVGEPILRFATSYDRERFFLDIPAAQRNNNRTRYGYELPGGRIVRSLNIENLLGRYVTAVYDGGPEGTSEQKLVFETNPTGRETLRTIFFLEITEPTEEAFYLREVEGDEFGLENETDEYYLLENSGGSEYLSITDEVIPKNIYPDINSDDNFYVIQEDDFEEPL